MSPFIVKMAISFLVGLIRFQTFRMRSTALCALTCVRSHFVAKIDKIPPLGGNIGFALPIADEQAGTRCTFRFSAGRRNET